MIIDSINEQTGFMNGEKFESEEQIREYFTVENMVAMFGDCYGRNPEREQKQLSEMADVVIKYRWHCDF